MKCKYCKQEMQSKTIQNIPAQKLIWGPTSKEEMSWEKAEKWCKDQKGRLPTRSELLRAYEDGIVGFDEAYYWSSAESGTNNAFCVRLSTGGVGTSTKYTAYYVRCVLDRLKAPTAKGRISK